MSPCPRPGQHAGGLQLPTSSLLHGAKFSDNLSPRPNGDFTPVWQVADMSQLQTTASRLLPSHSRVLASVGELIDDLGPTATGELLDLFAAHVSQTIARLHRGSNEKSLAALGRIAHTMKGTAGCYGAVELRETSSRLATACKAGAG